MTPQTPQNDCAVCRYWGERLSTLGDALGDEKRARLELNEHLERTHNSRSEVGTPGRGER
jgi:hypothetical protein